MKANLFKFTKKYFCKKRMVLNHLHIRKMRKIVDDIVEPLEDDDRTYELKSLQSEAFHSGLFKELSNIKI
jgi:hypothetical protein